MRTRLTSSLILILILFVFGLCVDPHTCLAQFGEELSDLEDDLQDAANEGKDAVEKAGRHI